MSRVRAIAGVILLLGLFQGQARGAPPAHIMWLADRGMHRQVLKQGREVLASDPDNSDVHALMGMAEARLGNFGDAVAAFTFGEGAAPYETQGIHQHADALREVGQWDAAIDLRMGMLISGVLPVAQELVMYLSLVDDHLAAGDLGMAEDSVLHALGMRPRSPVAHAAMAEIRLAQGDARGAGFHLWMAGEDQQSTRGLRLRARLALAEGNLVAANEYVQIAIALRHSNLRIRALQAELLRQEGRVNEAVALVEMARWRASEHPELMLARVRGWADVGRMAEARSCAARAAAVYPGHPTVLEAADHLRRAQERVDPR